MQLWGMLETLQSIPLWLFLCFALLLVALAWWQAPRIRPQLVGFRNSKTNKDQPRNNINYWGWRLFYLFLAMISGLVLESILWQQSTLVNTKDAEGKNITQAIPVSYGVKRRAWQIGLRPMPTLVSIPAGKFMMGSEGSSREQPIHEVSIPKAFLMSQHEVTFEQYDYFIWAMNEAGLQNLSSGTPVDYEYPNDQGWGRDNRPVINVSWYDAQSYVNWLSQETDQQCRLPSEAEWEYAARAGTTTTYPWGDEANRGNANYGKEGCCGGLAEGNDKWRNAAPVGSFPSNDFALYDMHGNVYEWVQDTWHDNYVGAPNEGEALVNSDDNRVLRGGSWLDSAYYLRSAYRRGMTPSSRSRMLGFRVVCSPHLFADQLTLPFPLR